MESIFNQLEQKLRADQEFLNKKVNDLVETMEDQRMLSSLFDLTTLCNKYVEYVIKKKEKSSLDDAIGDVWVGMSLMEMVKNQKDSDYYMRALEQLESKANILGKRNVRPPDVQPIMPVRNGQEEEKKGDNVNMRDEYKEYRLSEEDKELIELYGPKIRVIRWFFENDAIIQNKIKKQKNFGNPNNKDYDDYYGEEDPEEVEDEKDWETINGLGYQGLTEENSKIIEEAFQQYLKDKKTQETYIQSGDDIYQIRFDKALNGNWAIVNTTTQAGRHLLRQEKIKGPFKEQKTFEWTLIDDGQVIPAFDKRNQGDMSSAYEECLAKKQDTAKYILFNQTKHIFCVEIAQTNKPFLINMDTMKKLPVKKDETIKRWDYVKTFKPPMHLSIESGQIYEIIQLHPGQDEYNFVSKKFITTYAPVAAGGLMVGAGGVFGNPFAGMVNPAGLGKVFKGKRKPAYNPGVGANVTILKIEKVFNCVLYDKFMNEFKRMIRKYPHKNVKDIMRHLFHGTNQTDPKMIFQSEDGLDIRFSNSGAYGNGVYFANNSAYSHSFTHRKGNKCQMFMALVLVGDSVQLPGGQYRIPPLKKGSQIERYDSINNGAAGHFIIYDNVKSYPGYLITYQ